MQTLLSTMVLLLGALTVFSPDAFAQSAGMEDVVYFKNGEVLRGQILENREESLTIETAGRNVFVVRMDEVQEITKEENPAPEYVAASGYVNQTGLAILPGRGGASRRLQMVHGYRMSPHFSVGAGLGYTTYNDPVNLVSFFLDLRYNLLDAGVTPFVSLKGGYGVSIWTDEDIPVEQHRGGLMLNPGMGIQYNTRGRHAWYLSMGYSSERTAYEWEDWGDRIVEEHIIYRRIEIGVGLTF